MRSRLRTAATVACLVASTPVALLAGVGAARKPKPQLCPDTRYVVTSATDLIGTPGASAVVLRQQAGHVTAEGACAPTSGAAKATKKATTLTVKWATCGAAQKIVLKAHTTGSCDTLAGTIKAKKHKAAAFAAAKSQCNDGIVDAGSGEQCDGNACPGGPCKSDCTCPAAAASVVGRIVDAHGALAGVSVQDVGGTASGTTGADGRVTLSLANGVPHTLKLSKAGYADQLHTFQTPTGTTGYSFERGMLPREASQDADATAGGTVTGKDGATIQLPAGGLVDGNGTPVTGTVQVSQTPVDVSGADVAGFPGKFEGVETGGAHKPIATFGTVEYVVAQGGQRLQLAQGQHATIDIPIYTTQNLDGSDVQAGDMISLWSLDETTGVWMQEGTGTVVASASSPTLLAFRAQVGHLSWWNCDIAFFPPYRPRPRCYIDLGNGQLSETECSIGPQPYGVQEVQPIVRARPRAIPPGFKRVPNYAVREFIPIGGGVVTQVPADVDVVLRGCSIDGTKCGLKTVHGAGGVEEDVSITLLALDDGDGETITAPWNKVYAIDPAGQVDRYTFDGLAGEHYGVVVGRFETSSLEGTLKVTTENGTPIDGASFGLQQASVTVVLPADGHYKIEVDGTAHEPGGYFLQLVKLAAPIEQPITLPFHYYPYEIPSNTKQFDRYVFNGQAGHVYSATLTAYFTGADVGGTVRISTRAGQEVARATIGRGEDVALVATAPSTGEYLLDVFASSTPGNTQEFDVFVEEQTTVVESDVVVPVRQTAPAGEAGKLHRYHFMANVDDELRLIFENAPSSNPAGRVVLSRSGSTLATAQIGSGSSVFAQNRITQRLDATGEYTFDVRCDGPCDGYTLSIQPVMELPLDTAAPGTIAQAGDIVSYAFDGTLNQYVGLDVVAEAAPNTFYFSLFAPPGLTADPGNLVKLKGTGRFTIDVASTSNATGAYTLGLSNIEQPADVPFVTGVATASGTIAVPGDQKFWSVQLTQGDQYMIALDTPMPQSGLGLGAYWYLRSSGGYFYNGNIKTALSTAGQNNHQNTQHAELLQPFTVPTTDTYYIQLYQTEQYPYLSNATGDFTWTMTKQ